MKKRLMLPVFVIFKSDLSPEFLQAKEDHKDAGLDGILSAESLVHAVQT